MNIVERAARRRLFTVTFEHLALAVISICGAAILLLLLGTDILAWPWLLAISVPGILMAGARVRSGLLSRYSVAQLLDRRLRLGDSLSTAWFLLSDPRAPVDAFAKAQIARAELNSSGIQSAAAFPFLWRRNWALAGALCAAAAGLFGIRYFTTSTLSLKNSWLPLPALLMSRQAAEAGVPPAQNSRSQTLAAGDRRRGPAQSHTSEKRVSDAPGQGAKQETAKTGGSGNAPASPPRDADAQQLKSGDGPRLAGAKSSSGANDSKSENRAPGNRPAGSAQEKADARQENQSASSLGEKMKDALSGLLDKMRPRESASGKTADERAQENPSKANPGDANSQKARMNSNAPTSPDQQKQGRDGTAQGKATAQASERLSASAQGASDESAGHKGNDAHSGIGRQDGIKSLKDAEQLRAMGKLQEIIGKRSATLTGDMTVETQSGHQQLQTQYTGRLGHHADLGGEIDRNEVPVALQNYVRDYMEQVRKQANGNQ